MYSTPFQNQAHLITLMDEALSSPRGIRLHFLTGNAAQTTRNVLGKVRKRQSAHMSALAGLSPEDPGFGQSQYSTLSFTVEPDITNLHLDVRFLFHSSSKAQNRTTLLSSLASHIGKVSLSERDLLRPITQGPLLSLLSICTVHCTVTTEDGPVNLFLEKAPSFGYAWGQLQKLLPAWLYIRPIVDELTFEHI